MRIGGKWAGLRAGWSLYDELHRLGYPGERRGANPKSRAVKRGCTASTVTAAGRPLTDWRTRPKMRHDLKKQLTSCAPG